MPGCRVPRLTTTKGATAHRACSYPQIGVILLDRDVVFVEIVAVLWL